MRSSGSNSFRGRRSRSGHSLSAGLEKRVASYAAAARADGGRSRARAPEVTDVITSAASAVGVGLVLTVAPASARIVYTPAYTVVPATTYSFRLPLDLNHDGITDFSLRDQPPMPFTYGKGLAVNPALAGNAILGKKKNIPPCGSFYFASALPAGRRIGPGSAFGRYTFMFGSAPSALSCYGPWGYWAKLNGRFLGLEFTINGEKHFGWARLNVLASSRPVSATLTGYAYETVPGKPIRAGETGPVVGDAQPPARQPVTLGLLARGSAGLDMWRKDEDTALGG